MMVVVVVMVVGGGGGGGGDGDGGGWKTEMERLKTRQLNAYTLKTDMTSEILYKNVSIKLNMLFMCVFIKCHNESKAT